MDLRRSVWHSGNQLGWSVWESTFEPVWVHLFKGRSYGHCSVLWLPPQWHILLLLLLHRHKLTLSPPQNMCYWCHPFRVVWRQQVNYQASQRRPCCIRHRYGMIIQFFYFRRCVFYGCLVWVQLPLSEAYSCMTVFSQVPPSPQSSALRTPLYQSRTVNRL